jgi:hypothetical protein
MLFALMQWLRDLPPVARVVELPWHRVGELYVGEKLALGTLLAVVVIETIAAVNRMFAGNFPWPKPRQKVRAPKRKKGIGIKWVILTLIALLPGGLVGMAAIYAVMGREHWRRDGLHIVGVSLVPGMLLAVLRAPALPWPELRDTVYVSGLIGLVFGLLHVWVLIKLLREWWGEPDECVAWWPPLALWGQVGMLVGAIVRMLA